MQDAYILFLVLITTMISFAIGRWRYDGVALMALVVAVVIGIVPVGRAFSGFSNPAVITVAGVMIISAAIMRSGVVNMVVHRLARVTGNNIVLQVGSLTIIAAILSGFMNNVGALALMMPVAIQTAVKSKYPPSRILMPLAFGSILGGLLTAIGTPPNILISSFREELTGQAFAMFDFTPVGIVVAISGIVFITLIGWWLMPKERKGTTGAEELFKIQDYITEIKIPVDSPLVDKTVRQVERAAEGDVEILGIIRNKRKRLKNIAKYVLQQGDILIVEATHADLHQFLRKGKLQLIGEREISSETLRSKDTATIEVVIPPGARIEGRSSRSMKLRTRYRINLLAIARAGSSLKQERLHRVGLRAGDVVLLQGDAETLRETVVSLGFLPLAERAIQVGSKVQAFIPIGIFAIAIICIVTNLLAVQIAFIAAVLLMILLKAMPARLVYDSVDWRVIILLGAMIPLGTAMQTTGATDLIARSLIELAGYYHHVVLLIILMAITMTLSDFMNNAATAVIMAPIAISVAQTLNLNPDSFLMTVAIGASCSFLTPIGHQNNILVMGPGGYKFSDYIRLGLPVELIVLATSIPMILWVWPL